MVSRKNKNKKIKKLIGLDISEKMIELAKIRCKRLKNVEFYCGNMENTSFGNNIFDVCVIIDALHHVPNLIKTIEEMKRIGKTLILSEPNALNPIRRPNKLKFRNEGVKEISFYKWQLMMSLTKAGYNDVSIYHQHFIPGFIPDPFFKFFVKIEPLIAKIINNFSGSLLIFATDHHTVISSQDNS